MTAQEKARRQAQLRRQQLQKQQQQQQKQKTQKKQQAPKSGNGASARPHHATGTEPRRPVPTAEQLRRQKAQLAAREKRLKEEQKQAKRAYRAQKAEQKQMRAQHEAMLEQRRRAEKQRKKAYYKTQRKRIWKARLRLFALLFVLLLIVSISAFFVFLRFAHNTHVFPVTYKYGAVEDSQITVKGSASQSFHDGVMYVNFSPIAQMCNMIVVGDETQMRYVSRDDYNENILFRAGEYNAIVNGLTWQMEDTAVWDDGDVWLPYSFVSKYVLGIQCELKGHTLTLSRKYVDEKMTPEKAKEDEPVQDIAFLLKGTATLSPLTDTDGVQALGFAADLSAYEEYMNPENRDDYLLLVNKDNPITAEQEPPDDKLVIVSYERLDGNADRYMDVTAEMALQAMFLDMEANGFTDVSVTHAYQSFSSIRYLYNQAQAQGVTASLPGTLDSETGLSCDMHNMEKEDIAFGETDAGKWLAENSWKYGFILRYPSDKTEKTGVSYQPWHFRFVTRYHATRMREMGYCLEEYIDYLKKNGYLAS